MTDLPEELRTPDHEPDALDGAGVARSTRERLVQTAMRLFHEQGYHATGVATILREAGVNSGSLYHFFPGKEALLVAVLEMYIDWLRPVILEPAEKATTDPIERVFALLDQYRQGLVMTGCTKGCPIGNLALELADDHPAARALIDRNFRNWTKGVADWLRSAGDRLPRDVDRDAIAQLVLTIMEGGLMQARAAGGIGPFDAAVAQLRNYFRMLEEHATEGEKT